MLKSLAKAWMKTSWSRDLLRLESKNVFKSSSDVSCLLRLSFHVDQPVPLSSAHLAQRGTTLFQLGVKRVKWKCFLSELSHMASKGPLRKCPRYWRKPTKSLSSMPDMLASVAVRPSRSRSASISLSRLKLKDNSPALGTCHMPTDGFLMQAMPSMLFCWKGLSQGVVAQGVVHVPHWSVHRHLLCESRF